MDGAPALVCLFHYSLYFFSFVPTSFLPFLVLLRVSFICAYLPRSEGHRLLGLYYFFLFPHGLSNWLDISSCLTNSLGFCPFFLFPRAYCPIFSSFVSIGLLAIISYHVIPWGVYLSYWTFMAYLLCLLPSIVPMDLLVATLATLALLGFLPFFLGFHSPTLLLPLVMPMGLLATIPASCYANWVFLLLSLGFHSPFTLLLPFVVRMGLLVAIPTTLARLVFLPLFLGFHSLFAFIMFLPFFSSFFTIGLFCYWALCQKWVSTMSFRLFQLLGSKTLGTKCIRTS